MKKRKRLLWVLAAVCVLLLLLFLSRCSGNTAGETDGPSVTPNAAGTETAGSAGEYAPPEDLREIAFRYNTGAEDGTALCYYSDAYFSGSAYEYRQSLATASLCLAMSAFGSWSGGYGAKSANARNLLRDMGFPEGAVRANEWFSVKPEVDSIGVVTGSKTIEADGETYTLIALAVRGGGYEREWGSNFTLGTEGEHQGFREARDNALSFLREYVEEQGIAGPVKLWITGFSRAAATANLLSGAIDGGAEIGNGLTCAPENLYAYCFEPPAGAVASEVRGQEMYYNIFNIVNQSDPVPFVAPSALNFGRYGMDRYLPSAQSSSRYGEERERMLAVYETLPGAGTYIVDDFQMQKITGLDHWLPGGEKVSLRIEEDVRNRYSQGVFLANYITIFAKDFIRDRDNYVARYQNEIRELCSIFFGCTKAQSDALTASLMGKAQREWGELLKSYLWNTSLNPGGTEEDALQIISNWLLRAVEDAGITDYDAQTLDSAGRHLSDLFLALIANHPNYFTTLLLNLSGMGAAHYPELCYAWLASMDPNYGFAGEPSFNNGSYRVVRVNCEVDVRVTDEAGLVVAAIVDEEPQELGTIISAVNEDGEKIIILPVDTAYQVEVTPRENASLLSGSDGEAEPVEVRYTVDEYSGLAGEYARTVDFAESTLSQEGTLTGDVPAYTPEEITADAPEGSETEYTLTLTEGAASGMEDGTEVDAASDLAGSDAAEAWYQVTVRSEDESRGIALGGGARLYGSFAQVDSAAREGYRLEGWYENGALVSTEEAYRFEVTGDTELTARFTAGEPGRYAVTVPEPEDAGRVYAFPQLARKGDTVTLTVRPAPDWELGELTARDSTGALIPLTYAGLNRYRFPMPESPVTAEVSFRSWRYPFTDVPAGSYYYDAVYWSVENGVTRGVTADTFRPDAVCTRAQTAAFLWRAAGSPEPGSMESTFPDLSPEAYYYKAALWAAENGLTDGITADTFAPYTPMTRGEAALLLYRAAGGEAGDAANPFTDVPPDSALYDAVRWAAESGVTEGTSADTFSPEQPCTRAQIAAFLYRTFAER